MSQKNPLRRAGCVCLALAMTACGASSPGASDDTTAAKAREGEPAGAVARGPVLSVYVAEPSPSDGDPATHASEITLINTGTEPADVTDARAHFEAWRGDQRVACDPEESALEGPPTVAAGDAVVYRATATCAEATRGEEVRVHVSLVLEGSDIRRERHYVSGR